jgi:hypothetical protein
MGKYVLESKTFAALEGSHKGTGTFSGNTVVVKPQSVNKDAKSPLEFDKNASYRITVMSLEIATSEAPNWFGVSFRHGISAFDTVNIFCHPHPGNAGMKDEDYATRSGEWRKLFRYTEILGRQMDIAKTNHITIIPFFNNASYGSSGIFGPNWKDIVEQILTLVRGQAAIPQTPTARPYPGYSPVEPFSGSSATHKKGTPAPAVDPSGRLQHVVLSDFSHGRQLLWTVRKQSPSMERFLREVWDFDGVHAAAPVSPRAIFYFAMGGGGAASPDNYPVPPGRWLDWHHKLLEPKQMHGDVPAMLAYHAATSSRVG